MILNKFSLYTEIIEQVRAGFDPPYRPIMPKTSTLHEQDTVRVMQECWDEDPDRRPALHVIINKLKRINGGRLVMLLSTNSGESMMAG